MTELTYCYQATANVNGNELAVIQDTFRFCGDKICQGSSEANNTQPDVIAGIVIAIIAVVVVLFTAFIIAVLLKVHHKKTKGAISTLKNQAYDSTPHDKGVGEVVYSYPQVEIIDNNIRVMQNESYGCTK